MIQKIRKFLCRLGLHKTEEVLEHQTISGVLKNVRLCSVCETIWTEEYNRLEDVYYWSKWREDE